MFENIHLIPIIVSSLLAIAIGSIWYSPLVFGKYWMEAVGFKESDLNDSKTQIIKLFILGFFAHLVLLFALAKFVVHAQIIKESIWPVAKLLALLIASALTVLTIWERRSCMYLCINVGYSIIVIFGGMAVIAYWPW